MKSKIDSETLYPTLIAYFFYIAHALYLPRLSNFLKDKTATYNYQWPIRLILESFNDQLFAKWLIVIFCVLIYFFSIFYGRKKSIQILVVITNFLYISMNSFPALGINVYESYCFLYFSIALVFFDLSKEYFIDKYKVLIALAVSPYILSGVIKIYHYRDFLKDKILLNKIIEVEYFSTQTSFILPFLRGYDIPTYPILPLIIALQVSGLLALCSQRFQKVWVPSILFFHLSNTLLFNINFFFSFLILPFTFIKKKEHFTNDLFKSLFYYLLIFTGSNLYKLTITPSLEDSSSILRFFSIIYFLIIFVGMFFNKNFFVRALVTLFLINNAVLFLVYNLPFSIADYVILIFMAFKFLKKPESTLSDIQETLLRAIVFIGNLRAFIILYAFIKKLSFIDLTSWKIPEAIYLMAELPGSKQWPTLVFVLICLIETSFRKIYLKKWALPLLIIAHLCIACFSNITSSFYLILIISVTALSNVKSSTTPNKWTIATCEG